MGKRTLQTLCGASEVSSDQTLWKCLLAEFIGTAILGECSVTNRDDLLEPVELCGSLIRALSPPSTRSIIHNAIFVITTQEPKE